MAFPLPAFLSRPSGPCPEAPVTVLGDLHGRADLLERALASAATPVVCVGDYIDRGPDSAGVLRTLMSAPDVTCLMGNHEAMLLAFLDDPAGNTAWLRHGGDTTAESFGVFPDPDPNTTATALARAIGPQMIAWLRARPRVWQSGTLVITHAGADPARSIEDQDPETFLWGHRDFGRRARRDGLWVLRGHVIVPEPVMARGAISIDTGAWATDRLTMAHIDQDRVTFAQA